MQEFHKQTDITLKNSFSQTQFIDWRTQPKAYKEYPKFFRRYNIDEYDELKFIKNFGKITQTKKYGQEEVNLRSNPSAGGLYPCEIYIQIRGVKGLLAGIYHYEPLSNMLVLVHELSMDGLESYFDNLNQQKFIFLISNVYFRSSWKYEKRAIRYLLLDTGHQLGAIYAALKTENIDFTINFDFDKKKLNEDFGFEGFEFFQACIITHQHKDYKCKKNLRDKIVNVSACDYQIREPFIEEFYNQSLNYTDKNLSVSDFLNEFSKIELQNTIQERRSIRGFKKEAISKEEFEFITNGIFDFIYNFGIELYFINNNIESMHQGCYKNVTLLKSGEYSEIATKLAFNQKLAGNSCFTLIFTSNDKDNYLRNYQLTGFLAHIIYLRSTHLDIGCSGIGAYLDDECKNFCETQNDILYLQAVGR